MACFIGTPKLCLLTKNQWLLAERNWKHEPRCDVRIPHAVCLLLQRGNASDFRLQQQLQWQRRHLPRRDAGGTKWAHTWKTKLYRKVRFQKSQKQLWSGYKEHDLKKDTGTLRWLGLINNQKGMLRPTLACYWTGWSGFRRVSARSEWYNSWISMSRTLITQVILLLEFKWVVQRNVEVLIYADTHANYNGGRR